MAPNIASGKRKTGRRLETEAGGLCRAHQQQADVRYQSEPVLPFGRLVALFLAARCRLASRFLVKGRLGVGRA